MEDKKVRQVHESQEERQHVRVQLGGGLRLRMQSPVKGIFTLEDVSLGGVSFVAGQVSLSQGTLCHGEVVFRLGRANLSMPVSFKVVYQDSGSQRTGGEFTVIDQENADLLRLLIGNHLAGEVTTLDDVIDNLKRDNYVAARRGKQDAPRRSMTARIRAVLVSGLFLLVGLLAITWVGWKLYQHAFVVRATEAWVSLPGKTLIMPENGYVQLLVDKNATTVERGQPLLTVSSRLVARLNNGVLLDEMNPRQIRALVDAAIFEVTLNSPCDCEIQNLWAVDGEYLQKEAPLMALIDPNAPAAITALFSSTGESSLVSPGQAVTITYLDGSTDSAARISEVLHDEEQGGIRVKIEPQSDIPSSAQHQPVSVMVQRQWLPAL